MDMQELTGAVFIDLEKAFDLVITSAFSINKNIMEFEAQVIIGCWIISAPAHRELNLGRNYHLAFPWIMEYTSGFIIRPLTLCALYQRPPTVLNAIQYQHVCR